MKNLNKIITCALCASMMFATPLYAEEEETSSVKKEEDVFVVLNPDGSVKSQTVSDWLHSDNGFHNYSDQSDLTNVTNLKGREDVQYEGDHLVWNSDVNDIYYQGNSDAALPISLSITYTLNGKTVSAEEAAGQSGHIVMTIHAENNVYETKVINGMQRTVYLPILTILGADLKSENFTNIKVDHGTLQSDNANQLIAAVMMPGVKNSLGNLLNGQLAQLKDYFVDTVTIEADVTDFVNPAFMFAAATSTEALKENKDDLAKFDISTSDLDKLSEAMNLLLNGAQQLKDGSLKIENGASLLYNGSVDLNGGLATLNSGLATLDSKSAELNAGMGLLADSVLATVNEKISASAGELAAAGVSDIDHLTFDDYDAKLTAAITTLAGAENGGLEANVKAQIKQAILTEGSDTRNQYIAGVKAQAETPVTNGVNAAIDQAAGDTAKAKLIETVKADPAIMTQIQGAAALQYYNSLPAEQQEGVKAQIRSANGLSQDAEVSNEMIATALSAGVWGNMSEDQQNQAILTAAGNEKLEQTKQAVLASDAFCQGIIAKYGMESLNLTSLDQVKAALIQAQIQAQIDNPDNVNAAVNNTYDNVEYKDGLTYKQYVNASIGAVSLAAASLQEAKESLESVEALVNGLKQYTNGVADAYKGSTTLYNGSTTLMNNLAELMSGSKTLTEGVETMINGLNQFNDDGISRITGATELQNIDTIEAVLDEMKDMAESYNTYSGASEGADSSVKFVMKTEQAKKQENTETVQEEAPVKVGFWQRIKALFGID